MPKRIMVPCECGALSYVDRYEDAIFCERCGADLEEQREAQREEDYGDDS